MYWCIGVLVCIGVVVSWYIGGVLVYWYWCGGILVCWCFDVLLGLCVGMLVICSLFSKSDVFFSLQWCVGDMFSFLFNGVLVIWSLFSSMECW